MAIVTLTDLENLKIKILETVAPANRTVYNSLEFKNKTVQDATGVEIDFFKLEPTEEIQIGDEALIDNKKAVGEYTMPNGDTWIFEDGKLKKITVKDSSLENNFKNEIARTVYRTNTNLK